MSPANRLPRLPRGRPPPAGRMKMADEFTLDRLNSFNAKFALPGSPRPRRPTRPRRLAQPPGRPLPATRNPQPATRNPQPRAAVPQHRHREPVQRCIHSHRGGRGLQGAVRGGGPRTVRGRSDIGCAGGARTPPRAAQVLLGLILYPAVRYFSKPGTAAESWVVAHSVMSFPNCARPHLRPGRRPAAAAARSVSTARAPAAAVPP